MSPAQKAATLRKELSGVYDDLASDKMQEIEDEIETARERAFDDQERIQDLRKRIGLYESQCDLAQVKKPGPQKDES